MNRISLIIISITIILLLLFASYLWQRRYLTYMQANLIHVMTLPRFFFWIGILCIPFDLFIMVPTVVFLDGGLLLAYLVFYLHMLLGEYLCIMAFLWRCVIAEDSLTFYLPLFPPKEIPFHEITSVKYTENRNLGGGSKKRLEGYRQKKKLFTVEESTLGFDVLYTVFLERGKLSPIPLNGYSKESLDCVPVLEDFSITENRENVIRSISTFLFSAVLCALSVWTWTRNELEWIYVLISILFLAVSLCDMIDTLLWKLTVGFRTISVRNSFGKTKTYDIRQITEIQETRNHLVLYVGEKKVVKIFKDHKNVPQLAERFYREGIEIRRVYH